MNEQTKATNPADFKPQPLSETEKSELQADIARQQKEQLKSEAHKDNAAITQEAAADAQKEQADEK